MTKMKFAMMAGQTTPWSELAGFVRFLDRETQFHSAFVIDHMVPGVPGAGDDTGICFEGWTALAALAAMTERIRPGVMVTGVTYRNPALVAKMAATVDHISNGRLELGIGAAWHEPEHDAYGWEFPSVRERQDRLEEAVQVIRLLFESEGRASFEGTYYRLDDAPFSPKPVQQPRPPIIVGGGGERRTLRTLARYGDVMNTGGTPDEMRRKIAVLEQHCRDAGRDPAEIEKTYHGALVVSDNAAFIDRVAAMVAADGSITADEVKRSMPIGNAAHVRAMVEEYARAGVQRMVIISVPPWKPDIYRRLNDEIVAAFA